MKSRDIVLMNLLRRNGGPNIEKVLVDTVEEQKARTN